MLTLEKKVNELGSKIWDAYNLTPLDPKRMGPKAIDGKENSLRLLDQKVKSEIANLKLQGKQWLRRNLVFFFLLSHLVVVVNLVLTGASLSMDFPSL